MSANFQGEVIQVLQDQNNPSNPEWYLYRITDGTGNIALFTNEDVKLEQGDFVEVKGAWTKRNHRGLAANIKTIDQIKKLPKQSKRLKDNLNYSPVLTLEGVNEGQRIQIPLKIVDMFPAQIHKVESKKIRAIDITGGYNTIMLFRDEIAKVQGMVEDEFFVTSGIVGNYHEKLQITLGPGGQIFRGKEAWDTKAGHLYFSHLDRTNPKVMEAMMSRKDTTYRFTSEICSELEKAVVSKLGAKFCSEFGLSIIEEFRPKLATFLYYKLFKPKRYKDDYFMLLRLIESGDGKVPEIPREYITYIKKQIMTICRKIKERKDLLSSPNTFVSYLTEMLYVFSVDLQSYLELNRSVEIG